MAEEIKKTAAKAAPKAASAAKKPAPAKKAEEQSEKKAAAPLKGMQHAKVVSRLEEEWKNNVVPMLMKKFGYTSVLAVPRLEKIVINMGVGEAAANTKEIEDAVADMTLIAGQHPVITKSKKAIANFKLREDQPIGCKVTLRGLRMYDFFDKLVSIDLPRVRDFHGVPTNSFDSRGNYALGVKEQLIFPEIDYDKISHLRGMDIIIVTSAKTDEEAFALLQALGMPFRK